jgi:hypothetical protein
MKRTTLALGALLFSLVGCQIKGGETDGEDPESEEPTGEQQAAIEKGDEAHTMIHDLLKLSDLLLEPAPNLGPQATEQENEEVIVDNVEGQGCGTVTFVPHGIKVDYGAGCTFGAVHVAGALTVSVTISGPGDAGSVDVSLAFEGLVLNGFDLDGTASFETSNGSTLGVVLDLAHAGADYAGDLTVIGSANSFSVNGSLAYAGGGASYSFAVDDLVVARGACWPHAGAWSASNPQLGWIEVEYDAASPSTGQATLSYSTPLGTVSTCFELTSYGACVATPCD